MLAIKDYALIVVKVDINNSLTDAYNNRISIIA